MSTRRGEINRSSFPIVTLVPGNACIIFPLPFYLSIDFKCFSFSRFRFRCRLVRQFLLLEWWRLSSGARIVRNLVRIGIAVFIREAASVLTRHAFILEQFYKFSGQRIRPTVNKTAAAKSCVREYSYPPLSRILCAYVCMLNRASQIACYMK